jgi:hypothetical protein
MRLVLFTCAESAAIDQTTNRLSIFRVMEEIGSPAFPGAWPQMWIIAAGIRDENDPSVYNLTMRITLTGQQQPIVAAPFMIDFQNRSRARALGQIAGLVLPNPGVLRFSLSDGTSELGFWEVTVTQLGSPSVNMRPTSAVAPASQPSVATSEAQNQKGGRRGRSSKTS